MNQDRRLTQTVYDAFVEIVASGSPNIRPGNIAEYMRVKNQPLGTWEILGVFYHLERAGKIRLDEAEACWGLVEEPEKAAHSK